MIRYFAFGLSALFLATLSILIASAQEADSPFADAAQEADNPFADPGDIAPPRTVIIPPVPGAPLAAAGGGVYMRSRWDGRPDDPETVELMEQDGEVGAQVAEAAARMKGLSDASERSEAEKQLAELVAQQFAVRQSLRERELMQLEAQVARLRELHQQRTEQKDRIVADRVQQLLREAEGLGWGDASAVGGGRTFEFRTGESSWQIPRGDRFDLQRRRVIVSEDAIEAAAEAAAAAAVGEAIPEDEEE